MDNKLPYKKLSDSNLANELVENRNVKPITIEEIVIFMINHVIFMMYNFFYFQQGRMIHAPQRIFLRTRRYPLVAF